MIGQLLVAAIFFGLVGYLVLYQIGRAARRGWRAATGRNRD